MLSRPMLNRIFPQSGQYQYPYSMMGLFFVSHYCHRNIDCVTLCVLFSRALLCMLLLYTVDDGLLCSGG